MNELDCVRLKRAFEDLPAGIEGTIVYKYNDDDFEVEFFDVANETLGVYTVSSAYLELAVPYVR